MAPAVDLEEQDAHWAKGLCRVPRQVAVLDKSLRLLPYSHKLVRMLFINLPVYLTVLVISCAICGYLLWSFYSKKLKKGGTRIRHLPAATAGGIRRRAPNVPTQRRPAARMHVGEETENAPVEPVERRPTTDGNDSDETLLTETPKKKVGAKKAAKIAEKERRKEEREAEERFREHQRKLEDQEIAKRKKAESEEERAVAAALASEAKRLEEEAAREQAEYEKLKLEFSIEEEGTEVVHRDSKAEAELTTQLIGAIKEAKIIPIEHLALDFNLKTEACVEKLKQLLASGQLTGLLDDRGKFVYITPDEYEAVAQFIERRGRVTLAELVENGPKLLKLSAS
ncbi:DDRGK domain-containing protein 1 [Paragonimus heterotremus]|uniref:DDRGK domain-containing protein 1 n=1 Tax=Paragonimus heterotremus TaxID=100268 RepID=A0A8J4SMI3_9TREM|nr:DDRGK domain-containing protein 1 [Paragonimus heterotremus]